MPTKTLVNEQGEPSHLELEHTWVEAYISQSDYRGGTGNQLSKAWVPLDPSFKQYEEKEGADLDDEVPFDAESLFKDIEDSAEVGDDWSTGVDEEIIEEKLEKHKDELEEYLENNHEDDRMVDVLGERRIVEEKYGVLPLSLPYQVEEVGEELADLGDSDDNLREKMTFELEIPQCRYGSHFGETVRYQAAIAELAGKRISLSFVAASEDDEEAIKSQLPDEPEDGEELDLDDLPDSIDPRGIELIPQLEVAGEVVAEASEATIDMGQRNQFELAFKHPKTDTADKQQINVTAGATYAINLNTGRVSSEHLDKILADLRELEDNLAEENIDNINPGDSNSDFLHTIGMAYYAQMDMYNQQFQEQSDVRSVRLTSAGITATSLNVETAFDGTTLEVKPGGLSIDLPREIHAAQSVEGDEEQTKAYNMVNGTLSSYLEGHIFAQMFEEEMEEDDEPVSTMHILQHANQAGIPVYTINDENKEALDELDYDSEKISKFESYIEAGREITVPEEEVTISGWSGTGYIVQNEDGTAAYMISGGLAGGTIGMLAGEVLRMMMINTVADSASSWTDELLELQRYEHIHGVKSSTRNLNSLANNASILATIFSTGNRLHKDYREYEGRDRAIATRITAAETVAGVGMGIAIGAAASIIGAPAFAATIATVITSFGIGKAADLVRDSFLGYFNIFEMYVLINSKKKLYCLDLKKVV